MKKCLVIFTLICSLACILVSLPETSVSAANESIPVGSGTVEYDPDYKPSSSSSKLPDTSADETEAETIIKTVIDTLSGIVGVVSVVMIIWGGIMYSMSAGDPGKTQLAKRIIITAIIGLVLSILAYLIIRTVFRVITEGKI